MFCRYETETEISLQSHYYYSETGRFLNADDVDYIGYSGEDVSYNMFAYCGNNVVNYIDTQGYVPAWQQLGFTYSKNSKDRLQKLKGEPPNEYIKWLKDGGTREVSGVYRKRFGVKTTLERLTYIPKSKVRSYYNEHFGSNPENITLEGLGLFADVYIASSNIPVLNHFGHILLAVNVMKYVIKLVKSQDKKAYEKAMNKNKGVAIIECSIWSSSNGGSVAISYKSWDGKGDLYELF